MGISDIFNILHNVVKAEDNRYKFSLKNMASKLGKTNPKAVKAMKIFRELDDNEIIRVVRKINKLDGKK